MYYHDLDSWYNNVNDDSLIDLAKDYFDGYMQRVFRGWEDSRALTSKVWTGGKLLNLGTLQWQTTNNYAVMGYSSDGLPHVGQIPGRQNQFVIAGFSGHGMPQI